MDPMETWLCLVTINFGGVPEQIFPKNIDFWELVDALIRLRKRYEDMRIPMGFDMVKPTRSDPIWGSNHILTLGLEIVHPHKMLGSLVYFCWSKNGMMIP
jgi:hypothetical protein